MQVYPVVIHKDPESDHGTQVPDLPGCCSAGSTRSEALAETREAIDAHLERMAMDGEVAPESSDLSIIQASGAYSDAIAFAVVEIELNKIELNKIELNKVSTETERVNVTQPKWLIPGIDASEPDRSRFLAESAIKALQEKRRRNVA